jgi:hypothetical protein
VKDSARASARVLLFVVGECFGSAPDAMPRSGRVVATSLLRGCQLPVCRRREADRSPENGPSTTHGKSPAKRLLEPVWQDLPRLGGDAYSIGAAGFEPAVSCPQSRRDNQASLRPVDPSLKRPRVSGRRPLAHNR